MQSVFQQVKLTSNIFRKYNTTKASCYSSWYLSYNWWSKQITSCWIFETVKMKDLEEQHFCVKFCFRVNKMFTGILKMFQQACGEDCMSRTQCYEHCNNLPAEVGRTSTDEDPWLGDLPCQSIITSYSVCYDSWKCCFTIQEMAEEVDITIGSCFICWPMIRKNCINISQELLGSRSSCWQKLLDKYCNMRWDLSLQIWCRNQGTIVTVSGE